MKGPKVSTPELEVLEGSPEGAAHVTACREYPAVVISVMVATVVVSDGAADSNAR